MRRLEYPLAFMLLFSACLGVAGEWPLEVSSDIPRALAHSAVSFVAMAVFFLVLPRFMKLPMQIFVAMVAGILCGWAMKMAGGGAFVVDYLNIFGTLFIQLLKVVVIPLIFASIVCGVAGIGDPRRLGSVGFKALAFYLCTTCMAVLIGLLCVNAIKPGAGRQSIKTRIEQARADEARAGEADTGTGSPSFGLRIQNEVIPAVIQNPIMAGQSPLVIIFFALMLGAVLAAMGEEGRPALDVFRSLDKAFVMLVMWVMKLAPMGVFCLMAKAIASLGINYVSMLALYCMTVVTGLGLHFAVLVFLVVPLLGRVSPLRYLRGIAPALELSFSTSSSSATLPVTIHCTSERVGADANVCNFMLPIGATVNMDGTALYQAVAVLFISQVLGLHLDLTQQFAVFATAILVSVGTAGIPGGSIALMPIVLGSVGIGAENIAIVIGVDRFLDMCRTLVNITGDSVGAVVVSRSEGLLFKNEPAE